MGMLDILKGAYLASGAVDKTLPVAAGNTVERGSILVEDGGEFRLCTTDDATAVGANSPIPYVALTATDRTAAMAGGKLYTGTGNGVDALAGALGVTGGYVVTAVPLNIDGEFRCSQFAGDPAVESLLTFGAGKLAAGTAGTHNIIGKVTKAKTQAYHNHKLINDGMAQGGPVDVIEFASFYVPKMA